MKKIIRPLVACLFVLGASTLQSAVACTAAEIAELRRMAAQSWSYYQNSGDRYHKIAAENYERAHRRCLRQAAGRYDDDDDDDDDTLDAAIDLMDAILDAL